MVVKAADTTGKHRSLPIQGMGVLQRNRQIA